MLTPIAIIFIVFAAVFFLALNLFRSLAKAISIAIVIMFILGIFVSYLVLKDAKEFAKVINNNKTTYLLNENGEIKTGFQANRLNISTFIALDEQDIENIRDEPPGKIFIINKEILNLTLQIPELELVGLDIETMLKSNSKDLRTQAFVLILGKSIEEQGPFEMVLHIKDGNITVEPKTPVVYVVTSTPRQLYKQAKGLVVNEASQRLNLVREEVGI